METMVLLAFIGGYIFTSLLLLKYPNLLHKKKQVRFRARHISHRGGAGENLENTMTAFKHAYKLGTDMLELDCHLTKDGQVVVSHDNHLCRSCGCEQLISETDYKDLPLLKETLPVDFHKCVETKGCNDRRMPLLSEVFHVFPETPVNIDIKVDDDRLIKKVSDLVEDFHRHELTAWGNKNEFIVKKCGKQNPNIPLIFSLRRVLTLLALFYTGLLPFVPLKETFLEVIMPSILLDDKFHHWFDKKYTLLIKLCDCLLMRPALFEHLEKRGVQVYLWVLNTEEEFERAFKLGATGIMTDFPTKLMEFLKKNPQYLK